MVSIYILMESLRYLKEYREYDREAADSNQRHHPDIDFKKIPSIFFVVGLFLKLYQLFFTHELNEYPFST